MSEFISTTNLFVQKDGKWLVIRRGKEVTDFKGYIMPPGGKQEENESIVETALRETLEETGVNAINPKLKIVGTHNHSYKNKVYLVFVFVADFQSKEDVECNEGDLEWLSTEQLLKEKSLWPDLKIYIPYLVSDSKDILYSYLEYDKDFTIIFKTLKHL